MRIALDARWIFAETSGIGRYTRELIREFARADAAANGDAPEFLLIFDDAARADRIRREYNLDAAPRMHILTVPWGLFSLNNQWWLPRRLRAWRADVYHGPNWMIPYRAFPRRGRRTACVVTIHDLIPLLFPEFTPRAWKTRLRPIFRALMRETVRRADAVVAPSEATRRDIVETFRLTPERAERIAVIPEAADERFCTEAAPPAAEAPVILYVGRRDPYKNLPLLVEAFARVRAAVPAARLRVIGPSDPRYPEAEARALALGVAGAVDWKGHVDFPELVEAYRRAAVFAMPSRYEGFGLPALEAMACGTPVVCTNAASLPEVVGDAALKVPPDDVAAFAEALRRVLTDATLAAELRARGLARAKQFSWRRAAEATLAVYARATSATGGNYAAERR